MTRNFIFLRFLNSIRLHYNATKTKEKEMQSNDNCYAIDQDAHFSTTSIGELLRSVREERGITLKEIAAKTRIHVGILVNLEKNNFSELPSKPYVRGFVRSLAVFLGIAPKKAIELLEAAYYQIALEKGALIPPMERSDNFIIKKLSDLKLPTKVPEMTGQKISGLFLVIVGAISIGIVSNYVNHIDINKNRTESLVTAEVAPVSEQIFPQSVPATAQENVSSEKPGEIPPDRQDKVQDPIQFRSSEPMTNYPTAISLTFPKTLQTLSNEGNIIPSSRY